MTPRQLLARTIGNSDYAGALERAASAFARYRSELPHIPYAYTRTRVLLAPDFELVAMQWAPGSVSPIHDHGSSRCWVLMLEGTLAVENFEREDEGDGPDVRMRATDTLDLKAGDLDHRLAPNELHRVYNRGEASAYSLQLYASPISTYRVFDEQSRTCRLVTATCDLHLDLDALTA